MKPKKSRPTNKRKSVTTMPTSQKFAKKRTHDHAAEDAHTVEDPKTTNVPQTPTGKATVLDGHEENERLVDILEKVVNREEEEEKGNEPSWDIDRIMHQIMIRPDKREEV